MKQMSNKCRAQNAKKTVTKMTQSWRKRETEGMETKEREKERERQREMEREIESGRMMVQCQNETEFKTMNFIFQE